MLVGEGLGLGGGGRSFASEQDKWGGRRGKGRYILYLCTWYVATAQSMYMIDLEAVHLPTDSNHVFLPDCLSDAQAAWLAAAFVPKFLCMQALVYLCMQAYPGQCMRKGLPCVHEIQSVTRGFLDALLCSVYSSM